MALSALSKDELVLHPRRVDIPRTFGRVLREACSSTPRNCQLNVRVALQHNEFELAPCDRVIASACNLCGKSYLACSCSRLFEGAVPESELRFAFPYWKYAAKSLSSREPVADVLRAMRSRE